MDTNIEGLAVKGEGMQGQERQRVSEMPSQDMRGFNPDNHLMDRYKDIQNGNYHPWKIVKDPRDQSGYTLFEPSIERGDECALVFLAKSDTDEYCAVKCYPRCSAEGAPQCIKAEEQILRAVKGTAKGFVKSLADTHFEYESHRYLPMSLATKGSLFNVIRETGPLSEVELKDVLIDVLEALALLHAKHIVHRNINPKHILADQAPGSKVGFRLCDFKAAVSIPDGKYKDWIGTPTYMAPEIHEAADSEYGPSVDVWSLGVTAYHLLLGRTPQSVDDYFIANLTRGGKLSYPKNASTEISKEVSDFIEACLAIDPAKRPSVEALQKHPFLTTANLNPAAVLSTVLEEQAEQFARMFDKMLADNKKQVPCQVRTTLDPYEHIKVLGNGQFGPILYTRDKKTGVYYVTKVMRRVKLMNERTIAPMFEEIKLLHSLVKSPYVMNLHELFVFKGDFYLVLEYCNGGDLEVYIQHSITELPLPLKELKQIAWNVALGLRELHVEKHVHGELKPRNVLIVKDESQRLVDVKLCDLGLSQEVEKLSGSRTIFGSFDFYAPEILEDVRAILTGTRKPGAATPQSDVFSLGALLYYVACGHCPFANSGRVGPVTFPTALAAKIPVEFQNLVRECLQPSPQARPTLEAVLQHPLFFMKVDIPVRASLLPYIYVDYILKEGKLGITMMESRRMGSDCELAVKVVDISARKSPAYMQRFTKEIDVLLKVNMVPTVIRIHDAFICKDTLNIVMDYCNGGDLETYVLSQGKLNKDISLEEKHFIAYCILHGLHSIHGKHQTHSELTPRNILLERDIKTLKLQRARIGDFGINRILVEGPVEVEKRPINSCYMAPELATGKYDYKADVWCFGMLLYFLYLEKHMHEHYSLEDIITGREIAELTATPKPQIPTNCLAMLLKCLSVNPAQRPTTQELLSHSIFYQFEGTFAGH